MHVLTLSMLARLKSTLYMSLRGQWEKMRCVLNWQAGRRDL